MRALSYLKYLRFHNDPPFRQVVGRHFQPNFVSGGQVGKAQPRFASHIRQQPVPISQFNSIHLVRQNFDYGTFNFDGTFSGHVKISDSPSVINTVCSK